MFKQKGHFIISSNKLCKTPLNYQDEIKDFLFQIKIPAKYKKTIRNELKEIGITFEKLFMEKNTAHQKLIDNINKVVFSQFTF